MRLFNEVKLKPNCKYPNQYYFVYYWTVFKGWFPDHIYKTFSYAKNKVYKKMESGNFIAKIVKYDCPFGEAQNIKYFTNVSDEDLFKVFLNEERAWEV